MLNKWIIFEHHLAIDTGDEILHPDAEELFAFVSGDAVDLDIPSPMDQISYLHYSNIGAPLKCEVSANSEGKIVLELYAIRKNKKWPVDMIQGHIIDHAVSDREWFYVVGDVDYLENVFKEAKVSQCGEISVGQYINIIKQEIFTAEKAIINNVSKETVANKMVPTGMVPVGINATLYDYQKKGYLWMKNMLEVGHGCILGDEMGLGKTLQVITLFQFFKSVKRLPALVVAPVSLLENWKRECNRFAPGLDVYIHHGSKRTGYAVELKKHDIVVISYNTAVSDLSMLKMIRWQCVVLDEAQNIKNPYSERAKAVKCITRETGIAVTGTPFENHVTDIWSLVDFAIPGLLGNLGVFQHKVTDDILGAEYIEPLLTPIMIRRKVKDVANDLPDKIIIPQPLTLSDEEQSMYESYRYDALKNVNSGSMASLPLLQKLRMFCTHPFLVNEDKGVDPSSCSIKYQRLCEIVEEIISNGEKVILFTSYKKMFEILCSDIPQRFGIEVKTINGDTPVEERQKIVDWFNGYSGTAMLALNPRAAGTGLNITGANHVIHYNLEWNPSLEDQASARAYRRGQNKTVFIYRLFYTNTVEQVVNERIERKRDISATAVVGTDGSTDRNDIIRALEIAPELH